MSAWAPEMRAGQGELAPERLEVRDLRIELASSRADVVSEVSFSVKAGEVLGLVGESGSGKTTVALALLGHARRGLRIAAGQILLDGENVLELKPAQRRAARGAKVAYVPQDPSAALNPALRVGTQLREALSEHPEAAGNIDQRIAEVLADASLDAASGVLRRYPHQLSGGQQQRVVIAMAFSCRPSLIVLDEPTTGLDVSTQHHVLETVRSLCRSYGVAAVYVSHDLAVVGGLVSQVAVMYAGRVIELGPTERFFTAPVHPYTRGLLAAVPSPDRAEILVGLEGQPPRPGRRPGAPSLRGAPTPLELHDPDPGPGAGRRPAGALPAGGRAGQRPGAAAGHRCGVSHTAGRRRPQPALGLSLVRPHARAARRQPRPCARVMPGGRRRVRLGQDHARPLHRRAAHELGRRHNVEVLEAVNVALPGGKLLVPDVVRP
jgi:ABC-type glutathione transport system ATPase component